MLIFTIMIILEMKKFQITIGMKLDLTQKFLKEEVIIQRSHIKISFISLEVMTFAKAF